MWLGDRPLRAADCIAYPGSHAMTSHRLRQHLRSLNSTAAEVLEDRSLLAAVVGSISIDGQAPEVLTPVNGVDLLALSDDDSTRIYSSDGTQAGTVQVADIPISQVLDQQVVGTQLFVVGRSDSVVSLWNISELPGQTVLVHDQILFNNGSDANFATMNGELYFSALSADPLVGTELFRSNGGPAELVADVVPGLALTDLHLPTNQGVRFEIWVNELDPETRQTVRSKVVHEVDVAPVSTFTASLPDGLYRYWIRPTDSNGDVGSWSERRDANVFNRVLNGEPSEFSVFSNALYFNARNEDGIRSLWKTDGSSAGTIAVGANVFEGKSIYSSGPHGFVEYDGQLFFSTTDGLHRTDGTNIVVLDLPRDTTAIGVANGRLFLAEPGHLSSLSSSTDVSPAELHQISTRSGNYGVNRFDSFTVIDDELVFQSVQTTATHSYNLSPSDDRHLPSSVPRSWHVKEGVWFRSDGTVDGTRQLPGPVYQYAEDDTAQRHNDFSIYESTPVGPSWLVRSDRTSIIEGDEIRQLGFANSAVLNNTVLAANRNYLSSVISETIREENISFTDLTGVHSIADEFWVAAADGDGRALFQIDLNLDLVSGPRISGPETQDVSGFGTVAIRTAGIIGFSWSDQHQSTFDVKIERVSHAFGHGTSIMSLESTQQSSFESHFDPGLHRIQVRSKLTDGAHSHWSELFLHVTEPTLDGPGILSPESNSDFVVYDSVAIAWDVDGFEDAVSFDLLTANGIVTGVSGATAQPTVGPGPGSISVRARYADGTVSRWGTPVEFYGVTAPAMQISPLTGDRVHARLLTSDEIRAVKYAVYDEATGIRVSEGTSGYARQNDDLYFSIPYSGTFRVVARSIFRAHGREYHSNAAERTVVVDLAHDLSRPLVHALYQDGELHIDWNHPGAATFDLQIAYSNDAVYGSELIGEFNGVQELEMSVPVPADSSQYRVTVTARDADGIISGNGVKRLTKNSRPAVQMVEGDGVQVTARPTITWGAPDVRLPTVSRYELLLAGDRETYRRTNIQGLSHTTDSDLGSDRYRIYVLAHFEDGTTGLWGQADGILTLQSTTTGPPHIISPSRQTTSSRPELRWQPDEVAAHYEVWLSSEADVTPIIHKTAHTESSLIPEAHLAGGDYRLWVRTHYADGTNSRWTPTYRFHVNAGQVVQVISGTGTQPVGQHTIEWLAFPGATSYEIYVNDVNSRHTPVYRESGITATSHDIGASMEPGKSYEVWVRAHRFGPISNWGNTPPILTIAGSQNRIPTLQVTGNTASWEVISTATQYELWVNEVDPANTNRTIGRVLRDFPTTTSVDMGLPAGTYRAWVRALVGSGTWALWSEPVTFVIP